MNNLCFTEWYTWYEDKSYDFVPIDEDIIDNFDYTPRSPPPLFTEYSKGKYKSVLCQELSMKMDLSED